MVGLGWVGLGWVGLGWVGLGWVGLVQFVINPWAQTFTMQKSHCSVDEGPAFGRQIHNFHFFPVVLEMWGWSRVALAPPSGMLCTCN